MQQKDSDRSLESAPEVIILSKEEAVQQESCAYAVITYIALFFGLLINYLYSIFLQEVMVSTI